jgi:hypothetical protein
MRIVSIRPRTLSGGGGDHRTIGARWDRGRSARTSLPLIVHGAGGMGKAVLVRGLADHLHAGGPVVLFDGFGAARWRDLADVDIVPSAP